MEQRGDEVHTTETEASGGSKEGVVRWVLLIGTLLAIVFLTLIWTSGALIQDDGADSETSVTGRMQNDQAAADARGEPIAPAMDASASAAASAPAATPGDAPAGDPRNDAQ
jgi:hypothetical protein